MTTTVPTIEIRFDHTGTDLIVVEGRGTFEAREALRKLGYTYDPERTRWVKPTPRRWEPRPELQDAAEQLAVALGGAVHVQMVPHGESWLEALYHDGNDWQRAITFI